MPRYRLIVAYDGTDFHGWQRQTLEGESLRTVQETLERAVTAVVREPVDVVGASRTDAGVHARGQVAAFGTAADLPPARMRAAVNARLPEDVRVVRAARVAEGFDPIGGCIAKGYRYEFAHGGARPLFSRRTTFWTHHRLDPVLMNRAARDLVGEHDFTSLTRLNHGRSTAVRTIYDCRVERRSPRRCRLSVCGNGFLYNMIRIIAGTLLDVGRGKLEPDGLPAIIAARDRAAAGATLAPQGLCLEWVRYDEPDPAAGGDG